MPSQGSNAMRVSAVIVAAGSGSRMSGAVSAAGGEARASSASGADGAGTAGAGTIKKQFADLCGKPVLAWALEAFFHSPIVTEVVLVAAEEDVTYCERLSSTQSGGTPFYVVAGGSTRQGSVAIGVRKASADRGFILIHDGARPFIDGATIKKSVEAAARVGASCVAVPVTDTIKIARNSLVECTPDRSSLWSAQTPQAFRTELILAAVERAERDGFTATDDVALVERLGADVEIVFGPYDNIKITTAKDMAVANEIAKSYFSNNIPHK